MRSVRLVKVGHSVFIQLYNVLKMEVLHCTKKFQEYQKRIFCNICVIYLEISGKMTTFTLSK